MKIPVLPVVALLSILAVYSAQGAALGGSEEEATIDNYAADSEPYITPFLNLEKLKAAFKPDEILNLHAILESLRRKFPFLNWDAFPKLKGLRSSIPDAQ